MLYEDDISKSFNSKRQCFSNQYEDSELQNIEINEQTDLQYKCEEEFYY